MTRGYTPNNVNEYTAVTTNSVTQTYAHDTGKRGNLERDDGFDDIQDDAFLYSYDPENRLTKVEYDSDVTDQTAALPMAEYRYDALGRRIEFKRYNDGGTLVETVRYYHDGQNVVAEYVVGGGQAEALARSFVNGSRYIDERVAMRDYVTVAGNAHPRDFYYLHQELYSEAGLAAANGSLAEAYVYDTYGQARIYQWPTGDFDRDGDVDSGENSDQSTLTSNYASPATTPWYDLDADGDADAADLAAMVTVSAPTELAYSAVSNPYLFTGRLTDTYHANSPTDVTHIRRLQENRERNYDAKHGRWMQHDPLGIRPGTMRLIVDPKKEYIDKVLLSNKLPYYATRSRRAQSKPSVVQWIAPMDMLQPKNQYADGMNLYEAVRSSPINRTDSWGYQCDPLYGCYPPAGGCYGPTQCDHGTRMCSAAGGYCVCWCEPDPPEIEYEWVCNKMKIAKDVFCCVGTNLSSLPGCAVAIGMCIDTFPLGCAFVPATCGNFGACALGAIGNNCQQVPKSKM